MFRDKMHDLGKLINILFILLCFFFLQLFFRRIDQARRMPRRSCVSAALVIAAIAYLATLGFAQSAEETAEVEEENLNPMPPVILSRHMAGRWKVQWKHGCTSLTTTGHADFRSSSDAIWNHRDTDGNVVAREIHGEGSNLSYIPFLTLLEKPKTGRTEDYAYQICSESLVSVPTGNRDPNGELEGLALTETRVFRGFVGEKIGDSFFLDRCAGGNNKNYNFFVTTIGEPLIAGEEIAGPSTRKFYEVRFQFRLPGRVGCAPETRLHDASSGAAPTKPRDASNQFWNDATKDALVDEGFDIIVFKRNDRRTKGLIESGNAVMIFSVLFILVRVYTSYRYNSKKLETRHDILKEVAEITSQDRNSKKKNN